MILDQPSNTAQPSSADSSSSTVGKPSMLSKQFDTAYTTEEHRKKGSQVHQTQELRRTLVSDPSRYVSPRARVPHRTTGAFSAKQSPQCETGPRQVKDLGLRMTPSSNKHLGHTTIRKA
ncbi:hypothetical protein CRG98_022012 [Punica granatum]|uniref:Uncharacterized protein n=1 Tax=Punica granatum TaxID=22663 RepID=A0A2I0JMP0_PUNGR|nr:hypothetical protein CRG98_022012 [Punica granatum]